MVTPAEKYNKKLPTVALIGRTNVGKSTLFNKLLGEEGAIVSSKKGTTRTSNEAVVWWRGESFKLIDTGGLDFDESKFESEIMAQVNMALARADVIVMVTDGQEGILPQEKQIAEALRKDEEERVILAANKIDNRKQEKAMDYNQWYKMGLGEPVQIAAASGRNVGDFLDELYERFEKIKTKPEPEAEIKDIINTTIIGKPNAGKSSLFNKLIGEEKVIVSPEAHTTREPHDTLTIFPYEEADEEKEQKIKFIDTAGIRKKTHIDESIEKKGVHKSIKSIEKSDIVLFVIDGSQQISHQDKRLGNLMKDRLKSVIVLINKWDLAEPDNPEMRQAVREKFFEDFPHLKFAPLLFISALTGKRVHRIFPNLIQAWEERHIYIEDEELQEFLSIAITKHSPPKGKGTQRPKLKGLVQVNTAPPIFELYVKAGTSLNKSYVNYLKNRLREQYGFFATPVSIKLVKVQ